MALAKPRIWLALFVALHVQAQGPGSEESARDAFKKGVEAFQKQDFAAAAKSLDLVPELGGYLSLYKHWFLAQSLLQMGEYQDSEVEFAKVENSPGSSELKYQAQFLHAEALFRQGKYQEAQRRLAPLERKWRKSYRYPEVLYRLMLTDLKLDSDRRVCPRAKKLYAKYPAHPYVVSWGMELSAVTVDGKKIPCVESGEDFANRIKNLQWGGEPEKAHKEIVARITKARPEEKLKLDMILASYLVAEGAVDDALNLLMRYYPTQKTDMAFLMLIGRAAARSGEYQTAVGAYERAYALSPRTKKGREALYQAAFLSYQFQDYDGAVRKFQQFAKQNPRSGLSKDAQWHLAWLQYLRADYKGALSRFETVYKTFKNRRGSSSPLRERVLYWMAMSNMRLRQFSEAREHLQAIVGKSPYSFYGLAAQARLESLPAPVEVAGARSPASLAISNLEGAANADEDKESEEQIAETSAEEVAESADEVGPEDSLQVSDFKDPAIRARIDVAQKLIDLGLNDLARWELWEAEKRTRNPDYLRRLIATYERIGSYNRAATIAELNFERERDQQGLEIGRTMWSAMFPQAFKPPVQTFSKKFGVDPEWVWAIMRAESVYKPDVISPVGAKGLMQMMPFTARNLMRLAGETEAANLDLLSPDLNIRLGAQYLARLKQKFKESLPLAAAAYNAGPHRVEGWLVNFGHLDTDEFVEHIPFLETRNYVKKVVRNHTLYRRLYSKDQKPVQYLAKVLGVPIPSRTPTRESWDAQ